MAAEPGRDYRPFCYGCFRPAAFCYCHAIPSIGNQTEIVILQHRSERVHPFNTARMVDRALMNSRLQIGTNLRLAQADLSLHSDAGLLFPSRDAADLCDLEWDARPRQLVVLDGTWHQAKTMLRDIPALHSLRQYKLAPAQPGNYRIRMEPNEHSLSTVEAVVAALTELEPETSGLNQLIRCFETMVETQLAHPNATYDGSTKGQSNCRNFNVPYPMLGNPDDLVVACGETTPRPRSGTVGKPQPPEHRFPVYWVAQRLGTDETFCLPIEHGGRLQRENFEHMRLPVNWWDSAVSLPEFRSQWQAFAKPHDVLVVPNQPTARLLTQCQIRLGTHFLLKSIQLGNQIKRPSQAELFQRLPKCETHPQLPGRAGRRLLESVALVRFLRAEGKRLKLADHEEKI